MLSSLIKKLWVLLVLASPSATFAQSTLEFSPCLVQLGALSEDGQCATLERHENPDDPTSPLLQLAVVKFAATNPNPSADAFTVIQGGPGMSSIDLFMQKRQAFEQIRRNRDVLLIDQRGTGRSHAFMCPIEDPSSMDVSPQEAQRLALECLQQFDGNPAFYTTTEAVRDLEALRAAAGYPTLTLYGVSYGTRVALEYLRAQPQHARALLLDGVVAPTVNLAGNEIALRSQQAFDRLVARCESEPTCSAEYGDLAAAFENARAQLQSAPVRVSFAHPVSGETMDREVSEADLLGAMRLMPYASESLALLPLLLSQARQGQFAMLAAQSVLMEEQFVNDYAIGMNNSVMCTEDYPYLTEANMQATQAEVANTYFGDTMAEMLKAMCEVWPRGVDYAESRELFDSDVPVLLMSGEADPITPPSNAEMVANMLSNARHVVVPAHGHGVFDRGCMIQLVSNFVDQANFQNFDASCVEREIAFPLFIDTAGPAQ